MYNKNLFGAERFQELEGEQAFVSHLISNYEYRMMNAEVAHFVIQHSIFVVRHYHGYMEHFFTPPAASPSPLSTR